MRTTTLVVGLLLATTTALAQQVQPTITSIIPNIAPVTGGTRVVIKGTGFSATCVICSPPCLTCSPPEVFFGGTPVQSKFIDSTTLEVVAPPLLPGTMRVTIRQHDTTGVTAENAFTVTGDPLAAFEPLLFPVFLPPIRGQFGSEFLTEARVWNKGASRPLKIYGNDVSCYLFDPVIPPTDPVQVLPGVPEAQLLTGCSQTTGRILYTPREDGPLLALGLRVLDTSRLAGIAGTEIPVVRERDFTTDGVALLNVPVRPNFRNLLRIYALSRSDEFVVVTIGDRATLVRLQAGRDEFEPAYGELTGFPIAPLPEQTSATVQITFPRTSPPLAHAPIWAFVTSTNAETQQITTVTPN